MSTAKLEDVFKHELLALHICIFMNLRTYLDKELATIEGDVPLSKRAIVSGVATI